jgi:hypothetical protein
MLKQIILKRYAYNCNEKNEGKPKQRLLLPECQDLVSHALVAWNWNATEALADFEEIGTTGPINKVILIIQLKCNLLAWFKKAWGILDTAVSHFIFPWHYECIGFPNYVRLLSPPRLLGACSAPSRRAYQYCNLSCLELGMLDISVRGILKGMLFD